MSEHKTLSRRHFLGGAIAVTAATAGGGVAWAVDRYLVPDVQIADTSSYEQSQSGSTTSATPSASSTSSASASEPVITSNTYASDALNITIDKVSVGSGSDTVTYFAADITVADATTCRAAFANNQFGQNVIAYTSEIAAANNAVFAINGDYYGFRDTGIVIRNGVAYRDAGARDALALYRDGTMKIVDETATTAAAMIADGVWQSWSFGPPIVSGGAIIDGISNVEVDTNFGNHSIQGEQPRTAIGMIDANHFVFIVVDGRSAGYSRGVTMTELAQLFVERGAQVAYNLDGGGSSVMWFNGSLFSNPLGKDQERGTSDIIYFA